MTLPTPSLDDRRFQEIVNEAKRLIPHYCPEWTDHNISDPGVTLIELFAWMTEMIIYRLNQVPDRLYTKFLELMGITLFPGAPARTELVFWLTAAQPQPVTVPASTQVSTVRAGPEDAVVFITDGDVVANPTELVACRTTTADGQEQDVWRNLRIPEEKVAVFPSTTPGDAIYFGFRGRLARNVVRLELEGVVAWVGVKPLEPPWAWEVSSRRGWLPATVLEDGTLAFQRSGALSMLLPAHHDALTLGETRAYWLRCRLTAWEQPRDNPERRPPRISNVQAATVGVSASAHHAQPVPQERLGRSDGSTGQIFTLRHTPILTRRPGETVRVITKDGTSSDWVEVANFSQSGPTDAHFAWDGATGEIRFGPRVHGLGRDVQHGAIPPSDAEIIVTGYRTGGGTRGNVGNHTLTVLRSAIPFVASVDNPQPAHGGVDPETVANAKLRGPLTLLTGQRAVTREDFERLAHEASAEVARARCLPPELLTSPSSGPEWTQRQWWKRWDRWWEEQLRESGGTLRDEAGELALAPSPPPITGPIRVLIAPRRDVPPEQLNLAELVPSEELLRTVQRYLDERRILTSSIELGNLWFQGIQVKATLNRAPTADGDVVKERVLSTLYRYINPLVGGPQATGWPFDRPLTVGEVYSLLASVDGVAFVDSVEVIPVVHMGTGELDQQPRQRVPLPPDALFASYQHEVTVQ